MDLARIKRIADTIEAKFPTNDLLAQQVMCLAEEAGEFVKESRRFLGMARVKGDIAEVKAELADVVITAYVTAEMFGFDLDAAIERGLLKIDNRGGM